MIQNPSDIVGLYLGRSERQTKGILEEAKGTVLIINDAHMPYPGVRSVSHHKYDSYRTAFIDALVADIQNAPGEDTSVILIGYPEQMEELFQESNPELARRFPIERAFHFPNFDDFQLGQILDLKLNRQRLGVTKEVIEVALGMLGRVRDRPNFGKSGGVENLLSHAKGAYQRRMSKTLMSERSERVVFEPQDFDTNYDGPSSAGENFQSLFKDVLGSKDVIAQFGSHQRIAAGMRLRGIDPRPYKLCFKVVITS